ncbi:hypothetical protein [Alishewanella jeotgali]|uniref:Uncharacterized protein n=1 Tax=Alishewanella jeotgali KCTC 22429 TaxID=1129374 RepID=H3ZIG5_9ALTE|nr:hypothetical protein [Alishewanella jeotgali]EHR39615.1 hypothetical protein AJE_15879 [Alishewanella jeotgali KCTC 22429]
MVSKLLSIAGKAAKAIVMHMAVKYAAELLVKNVIAAAERAAKQTDTDIDDQIVAALKAEQSVIIKLVNTSAKD